MLKIGSIEEKNGTYIINREFYRQGMVFKDEDAYRNRKNEPCYVSEVSDTVYTGQDFLDICNRQEDFADELFAEVDWQRPEVLMDENLMDDEWVVCEKCGALIDYGDGDTKCPNCGKEVSNKERSVTVASYRQVYKNKKRWIKKTFDNTIKNAKCIYSLNYHANSSIIFAVPRITVDKVEDNYVYFTSLYGNKRKISFLNFAEKLLENDAVKDIDDLVFSKIMKDDTDQDGAVMYYLDDKRAMRTLLHYFNQFGFESGKPGISSLEDLEI